MSNDLGMNFGFSTLLRNDDGAERMIINPFTGAPGESNAFLQLGIADPVTGEPDVELRTLRPQTLPKPRNVGKGKSVRVRCAITC